MNNLTLLEHPILQYKLTELRNKKTTSHSFRNIMAEMSSLLAYEATRDLELGLVEIETPIEKISSPCSKDDLILVSILRAGNAMVDGILRVVPFASVGHIGIYRDKFVNNTVEYYFKLPPKHEGKKVLLCDPMIATGNTIMASCDRLKQYGVDNVSILSILISEQALAKLNEAHPNIKVYAVSLEKGLTPDGYLIPGMGDAGDRLYGTV
jgi:uracil phosphoribosyltransferase